jgi:type II secretion system protein N
MATTSAEIVSLDEIQYKSKVKLVLYFLLTFFLFSMAFLNFYPVGEKLKSQIKLLTKNNPGCNPSFDEIRMEWLLPKIIISDLNIPAACLGRQGEDLKFNFVKLNYHFISFSPLGLPFRLDTEISGQPVSLYYVQGIGKQMIRLKDQKLVLNRLQPLLGGSFKLAGAVTVDLNLLMVANQINKLSFKAQSKDLQIPSQSIQSFTLPNLKLNEFYIEANSEVPPRVTVDRLIIGDPDSPIRANFKGKIELVNGGMAFSPLELNGEMAFSESFKQSMPLIDMMFQSFAQRDGFYQLKLGGTLGAPKPMAP